jgi:hypothetical protein
MMGVYLSWHLRKQPVRLFGPDLRDISQGLQEFCQEPQEIGQGLQDIDPKPQERVSSRGQ